MRLTRRQMMAGAVATALPFRRAFAGVTVDLGAMKIETLSDGHLMLPGDFFLGDVPMDQATTILARYGLGTREFTPDCNVTLMRDGTNTVLFDAGAGPDFMPTAGKIGAAFAALGLTPDDITHVVFTHGHPDHLWGLLDDFDEPVYPNATLMMGRAEFDYWRDPNTASTIGNRRLAFAAGAKRRLDLLADLFTFIEDGQEVLTGVAARATFGHSPGHMSYELRAGSESVMVLGDCIANHHIAFEQPGWPGGTDQDAALAEKTRIALLDQLAHDQMRFIGFHLPTPGIGRAERKDGGYRYVAET